MSHISRKSNGRYLVQWTDGGGRRQTRTVPTKELAKELDAAESVKRVRQVMGIVSHQELKIAEAQQKPVSDHLGDWRLSLEAKGRSSDHIARYYGYVEDVLSACGCASLADFCWMTASKWINAQCKDRKPKPWRQGTANHVRGALRQFGNFLLRDGRAVVNPFLQLTKQKITDEDRAFFRGELTVEEWQKIVHAADVGKPVYGMTGIERGMFYRVRLATAFRDPQLRALLPSSFDLNRGDPEIIPRLRGKLSHRGAKKISIEFAAMLQLWLANKAGGVPVFELPAKCDVVRMWRKDLAAAGVEEMNARGERRDFYAVRHTSISRAVRSAGIKAGQELAGHLNSRQTMEVYAHLAEQDHERILAGLPVVPLSASAALALQTAVQSGPFLSTGKAYNGEPKHAGNKQKTLRVSGVSEMGRAGIEPATHGFSVHCSTN